MQSRPDLIERRVMGWLIGFVLIRVETDQRQSCVPGAAKDSKLNPKETARAQRGSELGCSETVKDGGLV